MTVKLRIVFFTHGNAHLKQCSSELRHVVKNDILAVNMCTPSKVQIRTRLEVIGGRIARIQSSRAKGAVLTVEHTQIDEQDSLATVHLMPSRKDKNVHVAICLKMKDNIYYPVVERDTVTKKVSMRLECKTKPRDEFPEKYLFKWDSNGQFGSLCSVEEPSQYLSVEDSIVILSSHRDQSFRINLNNAERNEIILSNPCMSNTHFIIWPTYTVMDDKEISTVATMHVWGFERKHKGLLS